MSSPLPEVVFHIYPSDCDMLGHLNHASMLAFMERARWALLDPQPNGDDLMRQSVFGLVRHVDIGYRTKALPGDDLAIRAGILRVGKTSYTIRQEAAKLSTGELVAEANVVIVAVNGEGEPVPVPGEWKTSLPPWPQIA